MKIISGPAGLDIGTKLASHLGVEHIMPEYETFSDGETYIRIPEIQDDNILIVQSCYNPQEKHLFQLANLISTVKRLNGSYITAYVPYMCYARQDRDIRGGEAISIQTVLQILEKLQLDHLVTLDIHNPDVVKYIDKMKYSNIFPSISMKNYIIDNIPNPEELVIIAPDKGAVERAKSLANELKTQYDSMEKRRDPESGEVELKITDDFGNYKRVIIVDDIMSTGSTLLKASKLLKSTGTREIHYFITHIMGSQKVDSLNKIGGGRIIGTKSVPSENSLISPVEDVARLIKNEMDF